MAFSAQVLSTNATNESDKDALDVAGASGWPTTCYLIPSDFAFS